MNIIIKLLIFCIVLFIYLHVCFYLKKSNDLELYEIDSFSKNKLEEICDLRQPTLFHNNIEFLEKLKFDNLLNTYGAFDVKMQNLEKNNLKIPFPLKKAAEIIKNKEHYISESNEDFLEETCLNKEFKVQDALLRPYLVSNCEYDILFGSNKTTTPLRYEINYRNFFVVIEGEAVVKLTPPKNGRYLYCEKDYDTFEFKSPINPWNVQEKYKNTIDKIQFLELTLTPGRILFIPAYWWYTIQLKEKTLIASLKYRTYMNNVAIMPDFFMRLLQSQNIKHLVAHNISPVAHTTGISLKENTTEEPDEKPDEKPGENPEELLQT